MERTIEQNRTKSKAIIVNYLGVARSLIIIAFITCMGLVSCSEDVNLQDEAEQTEILVEKEDASDEASSTPIIVTAMVWIRHIVIFLLLLSVGIYVGFICWKASSGIGYLITPAFAILVYLSSAHFEISLAELLLQSVKVTYETTGAYYSYIKVLMYLISSILAGIFSSTVLANKKHLLGQLVITSVILLFLSLIDIYIAFLTNDIDSSISIDTIGFVLGTAIYCIMMLDKTDAEPIRFMHS
jgi:hypothetical protein